MASSSACHNCRRQRLKCGREKPQCAKCVKRGQECLGYGRLLRWEEGVASRGKMIGVRLDDITRKDGKQIVPSSSIACSTSSSRSVSPAGNETLPHLTDPILQDLGDTSRMYLYYFASNVCKDYVLYDIPQHNPFRELVPLTYRHPVLLQIIIANAALHMSNVVQKSIILGSPKASDRITKLTGSTPSIVRTELPTEHHQQALIAHQRSLSLLQSMLGNLASLDVDIILAVVLLFVEFELIDSGGKNWRYHIKGAKTIIETVCPTSLSPQRTMSQLRRWLISNCLVFDILGSTLARSSSATTNATFLNGAISLLHDTEGNHCSSFPAALLHLMKIGAQLLHLNETSEVCGTTSLQQQAHTILHHALSFDPHLWAANLQSRSPAPDLQQRIHVASAHQAAVCIYLARILLFLFPNTELSFDLDTAVSNIMTHLSLIAPGDALFTAIAWPTFIAGAETRDPAKRQWVVLKFVELWEVEPWGLMKGALGVLERIWSTSSCAESIADNEDQVDGCRSHHSWIDDLRKEGADWLIL